MFEVIHLNLDSPEGTLSDDLACLTAKLNKGYTIQIQYPYIDGNEHCVWVYLYKPIPEDMKRLVGENAVIPPAWTRKAQEN